MDFESLSVEEKVGKLTRAVRDLQIRMAVLTQRVEVCESRPEEIIARIEEIWREDPETGDDNNE
ncbi:MAG: hypothetical protein JXR49_00715 [Acidobacteria bacterium]|nr:hypothetical protein [Acidobacteriota bacterium]